MTEVAKNPASDLRGASGSRRNEESGSRKENEAVKNDAWVVAVVVRPCRVRSWQSHARCLEPFVLFFAKSKTEELKSFLVVER